MTSHNFWHGEKVRLRAIEQTDLDEIMNAPEEPDSWLERANDFIYLPVYREKAREQLVSGRDELTSGRERKDDAFDWLIENLAGQTVGSIATFDCDRRVGAFKYSIIIKRPFWRQGYASEAIKLVLRYYFWELRYQKVTVLVYSL